MIIVFSGLDGSGKTTLAKKVAEKYKEHGFNAKYIHGYEFSFSHNILRKIKKEKLRKFRASHTSNKKGKSALYLLWLYVLILDFSFKIRLLKLKKKAVYIFDRYIYDYIISCIYQRYKFTGILKFLMKVIPEPDFLFFLVTPKEVCFERRADEHSMEYFVDVIKLYDKILPESVHKFDSSKNDIEENINKIIKTINL